MRHSIYFLIISLAGFAQEEKGPIEKAKDKAQEIHDKNTASIDSESHKDWTDEQKDYAKGQISELLGLALGYLDGPNATDANADTLAKAYTDQMNIFEAGWWTDDDCKLEYEIQGSGSVDFSVREISSDVWQNGIIQIKINGSCPDGSKIEVEKVQAGLWQSGSIDLPAIKLINVGAQPKWESVLRIDATKKGKVCDIIYGQFEVLCKDKDNNLQQRCRKIFLIHLNR